MMEVRIVNAPDNGMRKYLGRIGAVVGLSGQFILVRFEGENMSHCFLPEDLSQR